MTILILAALLAKPWPKAMVCFSYPDHKYACFKTSDADSKEFEKQGALVVPSEVVQRWCKP